MLSVGGVARPIAFAGLLQPAVPGALQLSSALVALPFALVAESLTRGVSFDAFSFTLVALSVPVRRIA